MNETTTTGTALALPEPASLAVMFKTERGVDPLLARIEQDALLMVKDLDPAVKKDRELMKSAANKVSLSKAELDRQGKSLTEAQRKEIEVVNAARKACETFLAGLRDKVRKPADDWEAADEARKERIRARLTVFKPQTVPTATDLLRLLIAEVETVSVDATWQEFEGDATIAKASCLSRLADHLAAAMERDRLAEEAARQAAELEQLRAEKAAREAADRIEAERLAAVKAAHEAAERAAAEAEARAKAEAERLEKIERDRAAAVAFAAEQERAAAAEREAAIARQAQEAEERHRKELAEAEARRLRDLAEAKAREEAAAQAERDRIASEALARADADRRRAADQAHRLNIRTAIADALRTMSGAATPEAIADALMAGKIPHCEVKL